MNNEEITLNDFNERLAEAIDAIREINENLSEINKTLITLRWR